MGPVPAPALEAAVASSPLHPTYAEPIDRESAYERLHEAPPPTPAGDGDASEGRDS